MALLLAQHTNGAVWEGVVEFTATYRKALIAHAAATCPHNMVSCFEKAEEDLLALQEELARIVMQFDRCLERLTLVTAPTDLRRLLAEGYDQMYRHFNLFRSPLACFEMSSRLIFNYGARVAALCEKQTPLPVFSLLALGPVGRNEATRFCRVQLVLVTEDGVSAEQQEQLGTTLVSWMRAGGIPLDEGVSPLHSHWRGNLSQWRDRFAQARDQRDRSGLVELLRLADQRMMAGDAALAGRFAELCLESLRPREIVGNLADRSLMLTNGLSLLGKLKVERSGAYQGLFPLLDHALLPLASAVSALAIMYRIERIGTPERIKRMVEAGLMAVELGERVLQAWQCFSEHRLMLEQQASVGEDCRDILHLNPVTVDPLEEGRLVRALETITDLQRFLHACYGSYA